MAHTSASLAQLLDLKVLVAAVESSDGALWQPWSNFSDGKEGRFVPELLKSDFARPFASAIAGNFTSAKPIDIDILR